MKIIALILSLIAYICVETKYKLLSYLCWLISNIIWLIVTIKTEEFILSIAMIINSIFCAINIYKINKKNNDK